ncbi:putative beige protein homolog [Fusarium proliferatum ET1]|uniref:Beige protein homolog 1 n=1 Tax=Fusarium proliferatum (strain ET1) TaxID=1227346 RepID=A0A1L7UZ46_FUSPR|nr:putative beige protein homolog [Fusarium proliferatum ET1]CZR33024.1 probable beige protein homolog [Fusarium proliferatum ET1]
MASIPRRYRSSTSASNPPNSKSFEIIKGLLEALNLDTTLHKQDGYPQIPPLLRKLRHIIQHISATHSPVLQDDFRHADGFQTILNLLRAFSGYYDPDKRSDADMLALFKLLGDCLNLLSGALRGHSGNRRFFRYRVEGGGWEALEQVIASIGLGGAEPDAWISCHVFGKLLAFSLDDEALDLLCQSIAKSLRPDDENSPKEEEDDSAEEQWDLVLAKSAENITPGVKEVVNAKTIIRHPEILRAVVSFWMAIPRMKDGLANPASLLVLETIHSIIAVSIYNRAAVHSTGALSQFLRVAFNVDSALSPPEREKVLGICKMLMFLGVNEPADTQFLLSRPGFEASEFCLQMTSKHSGPPFFQFDLSLHGHSSLELASLGRSFPPQSSAGYTFTAWIRIDSFDPTAHTTIFGVFDSTQACFLLMYLERDTHNFILQTSVTSNKPSVRFKSVSFKEKKWYHIAIVHRRPKALVTSKASLYVNGEFSEQIRSNYPHLPPLSNGAHDSFASFNSNQNKTNPVQAFIGTPKDLSNQIGPGLVFSRWSLASAHLFEDALSDDFLAVHYGLGPRYQGNFQDSLGGFQTYEASATLGLRNEIAHPGKGETSDIIRAVREKAGSLLPESKILLSILPSATFPENVQFYDTGLLRSLPRNCARNLFRASNQEGAPLAINCAVPSLPDSLFRVQGLLQFRGNPIVAVPSYLDENLWRLAGFTPLALKLFERASSIEETVRSAEMLFYCIRQSWRNSEAIEKDNGYGILAMLLRVKLGYDRSSGDSTVTRLQVSNEDRDRLAFQLLSLILGFVGYNHTEPMESFIINPLAYRILLIDLDIWRKSAPRIQELYYKQFVTFAVKSKYHEFNSRRLIRMRIVKRLLDAMKGEVVSEDTISHFMGAFEVLVASNFSQEVMRSLSLFITYAFHSQPSSLPRTPRPLSAISRSSTPVPRRRGTPTDPTSAAVASGLKFLTKKQLGVKVLSMYSRILCEKGNTTHIKKFARTVTNKWLLYLLAEDDPEVVVHGCKILARLLVTHGSNYTSKFAGKSGGFIIMSNRLKRFWDMPTLWPICFSILFGYDVAEINFDRNFDFFSLLETFGKRKVVYPDSLSVITAMLQHGLKDVMRHQDDPDSPATHIDPSFALKKHASSTELRPRASSMNLATALETRSNFSRDSERVASYASVLHTVIRFLSDLHARSTEFRDFALNSEWVRLLLSALYPVIVSADAVTPETELNSGDTALTFEGTDVIIRPISGSASNATPIVRTTSVDPVPSPQSTPPKGTPLRRASSFILLTQQKSPVGPSPARLNPALPSLRSAPSKKPSSDILDGLLELVVNVFMDQLLARKDFPGFGLFTKVPPGFREHQAYFESYILKHVIAQLTNNVQLNQKAICEPRVLTNLSRFCTHMSEAIFEGWFMNGAEAMIDFVGMLLEFLQRPDISNLKSVRLCSQAVATIRSCLLRIILLRLSDLDNQETTLVEAKQFMDKMVYWQMSILGCFTSEDEFLKLFWYQLYTKLIGDKMPLRIAAANFLRIILVQKPEESATLIRSCMSPDQKQLTKDFQKLTGVDDESFVDWVDKHRPSLDVLFFGGMSKTWEDFVSLENVRTSETAKVRLTKRKDKLRSLHAESISTEKILISHDIGNSAWMKSIYNSEYFKYQRLMQDQQDDLVFLSAAYTKMERDLMRPGAVFSEAATPKWKLDRTEGRNRMRLRVLPDFTISKDEYQPKRKASEVLQTLRINTSASPAPSIQASAVTPTKPSAASALDGNTEQPQFTEEPESTEPAEQPSSGVAPEDDFELVDDPNDPNEGDEGFEDKNRKVMRRLERGDQVQSAYNISRIIGLEACEGILIIGKDALYIMDNVFQCANGDIVNVWQAPSEERDPFSQIVTDAKTSEKRQNNKEQESRHWRWQDVISISKRRFLFRDVAIEVFFTDGRSYLLTTINPVVRDNLFVKMLSKAPHTSGANTLPNPEDAWRLESLKVFDESPQGFGSKFGTFFNSSPWNPLLKKWQKGEISNFHYLMMVNTMAGRTFNDLTQYPVFPWVLADYTSEDLDLDDPNTFRDLSKPMGAQTPNRVGGFVESYNALAEIGEIPFHYGTHYSSAMIVSSYLIRLPPFVQSYILLQGGSFDHADRLFQSIPEAWKSASCKNKADVRELIPEFYCLPEFLTNVNGYNFGNRESNGVKVDHVELPPWAKGDPRIFIAKHREALESPYVSENLHQWIDLVFGYKQRGEAAVENLNVFHHLSYRGATDLDSITDAKERAILAGVIHNFGQTPHQVFMKSHPAREHVKSPVRRLDSSVFSLGCLPHPLLESHERVASLIHASKLDRLLCASPFRLNFPPYDKFLEWGFADNSIRFFFSDNRKPAGLFENLHIGQISCACFADSKTLITAGEDCVVSVYALQTLPGKPVELLPRSSLFGHKSPVTTIAVSKAFSTLLTASADGQAFLWDLNRLSFIRKLPLVRPVECARINDISGEILLCSGPNVILYTLNGTLLLEQNVCFEQDDYIHSCAFYEGAGNEWLDNYLIFTGHKRGRVNVWRRSIVGSRWTLELLRKLDHVDYKNDKGGNTEAGITCISPMPTCVYTGDDDGRVYEWNLLSRER